MAEVPLGVKVGSIIREHRLGKGWSQARLAEEVGVSTNYIGVLERGEKVAAVDMLVRISKVLGVLPGVLLGDTVPQDAWAARLAATASTIPPELREMTCDILRVISGAHRPRRKEHLRSRKRKP